MAKHLGICLFLLAGCAAPPAIETPPADAGARPARVVSVPPSPSALRIGVEHLAPHAQETLRPLGDALAEALLAPGRTSLMQARGPLPLRRGDEPRVSTVAPARPDDGRSAARRRPPIPSDAEPMERLGLRYLYELDPSRHDEGARKLDLLFPRDALWNLRGRDVHDPFWERRMEEEQALVERWEGPILRRPATRALREFPLYREVHGAWSGFLAENVPLSSAYQEAHEGRTDLGRFTLRVRSGGDDAPCEILYYRSGLRLGTSPSRWRVSYVWSLSERLTFAVGTRVRYDDGSTESSATLEYRVHDRARLRLIASDKLDLLSEPATFPALVRSDGAEPGIFLYVQHLF